MRKLLYMKEQSNNYRTLNSVPRIPVFGTGTLILICGDSLDQTPFS